MGRLATLWFDKDGVLAQYDYSLYESEYEAPAPWLVRNAHVFRNLDPYENMCDAVRRMYEETCNMSANKRRCNVRVLTAVSDGPTLSEHVIDGAEWCTKNVGLQKRDFYACAVSKETVPVVLRSKLDSLDILFDDYMPNLRKWKEAGGTAIKVVNGINSETDKFPCIYTEWESDVLYHAFCYIANTISTGEKLKTGGLLPFV